jgi:DNA-binding NtrC family response regulator
MLAEALRKSPDVSYHQPTSEYKALLPSSTIDKDYEDVEQYADSEEVTNEPASPVAQTKADAQREQIVRALRNNNGRRRDAARELFMSERTLYRKIKELGINEF